MSAHAHRSRPTIKSEPDHEVWQRILAQLRTANADICRQWFEEIEPLGIAGGVLRLRAHTAMHRDYLKKQCAGAFNDAARTVSGRLITIRFLGPEDDPADAVADAPRATPIPTTTTPKAAPIPVPAVQVPVAPAPAAPTGNGQHVASDKPPVAPSPQPIPVEVAVEPPVYDDGLILNPDYAFDNFVVGPGNRLAHAAAQSVASNPGRTYNPFFVHADVGLGKTHLLQAICLQIREAKPEAVIYYTSCEGFMTQFMDAVQAGHMTRFRHKFRHVDVLVIDDIHFLAKRDRTQEEFFHTFNSLYQSHKQIVLSSDAVPEEIPDLEDRLVSRFKWGLVTTLQPPCYETRVAILKSKAKIRGVDLPDDVACYVAGRIDSNIRELEGAVVKLQVTAQVDKVPISLALARAALGDDAARAEPKIQIQTIIAAVTDFFGVKVTDLQSKRRYRSIAQPRQLCMYLARKHTRYSLEEIGGYFGGRDHTTVMHAVKAVEDRRTTDEEFSAVIRTLEDKLRQPA